ncbi:MAG: acyl-CoA thioesterase [Gemmatimonadetes bacterium]|nr:MAG: acyl-CoA thioesterase [Gemmatimonadota bacterium]
MPNRPPQPPITVEMNDLVLPAYTNRYNALFGGKLMEMIDKAAAMCAIRYCHEHVVTASVEAIDFHTPIKANFLVHICAKTIYVGRSSMMIKVIVWSENPNNGERTHCCTSFVTMVAIDTKGKPQPVPPLRVTTPQEQQDWKTAEHIRQAALDRRSREKQYENSSR